MSNYTLYKKIFRLTNESKEFQTQKEIDLLNYCKDKTFPKDWTRIHKILRLDKLPRRDLAAPYLCFIAAAWKRWGAVNKRVFNKIQEKIFYHGQVDPFVPLKHTFEIAQGDPVGILLGGDHYAGKDYVSGEMPALVPIGKKLFQKYPDIFGVDGRSKGTLRNISWMQQKPDIIISHSGDGLPDWGLSGLASFEEVVQQIEWVNKIAGKSSNDAVTELKKYSLLQIL